MLVLDPTSQNLHRSRSSWQLERGYISPSRGTGMGQDGGCAWGNLQGPSHELPAALLPLDWDLVYQLSWWNLT